jgi:phosphoglycerol transferase MdoB-like AlkP superfamily enzyme
MAQLRSGTLATLLLAVLALGLSLWLGRSSNAVECDRLAPLGVVATLSAFIIALAFRQLGRAGTRAKRWQLALALLLAGGTLFGDIRFVAKYRNPCNQVQQQLKQTKIPSTDR